MGLPVTTMTTCCWTWAVEQGGKRAAGKRASERVVVVSAITEVVWCRVAW